MGTNGVPAQARVGVVVHSDKTLGGGLEELRAALADLGHADPPWYEVDASKKAPKMVRRLIKDDGVDRVLVWGGDGMVRRSIDAVMKRKAGDRVSIGILPAGTANLLAKNLGIPIDLRGSVRVALCGEPRRIDVGLVNREQHFAVMAGVGFDALMIRDADENGLKDRFGRLAYVWSAAHNTTISPAHAEVSVNGAPWFVGEASCVITANVGRLLGGIPAFPDASPTDGRLEVGVVTARSRSDWLRLAGAAVTHRVEASPFGEVTSANKIVVQLDRTLPWEADGGDRDRLDRFEIRCVPDAIAVCQP
ncbi:MAG: diacylglycerol kinase family protein [Acidimicrobiia bacterium]